MASRGRGRRRAWSVRAGSWWWPRSSSSCRASPASWRCGSSPGARRRLQTALDSRRRACQRQGLRGVRTASSNSPFSRAEKAENLDGQPLKRTGVDPSARSAPPAVTGRLGGDDATARRLGEQAHRRDANHARPAGDVGRIVAVNRLDRSFNAMRNTPSWFKTATIRQGRSSCRLLQVKRSSPATTQAVPKNAEVTSQPLQIQQSLASRPAHDGVSRQLVNRVVTAVTLCNALDPDHTSCAGAVSVTSSLGRFCPVIVTVI